MSSISLSGANARLSYKLNGAHIAALRCRQLTPSYSVNSEESHARTTRAFYPHLRVQGTFAMSFAFIGWREFSQGMAWFRDYVNAVLGSQTPSPMMVRMDSRQFLRLGIPTTGIAFGDHVGSMVFAPAISFISVSDPRDPKTSIISTSQASSATLPAGSPTATNWFYPGSKLNRPGALQKYIYDQASEAAAQSAAQLQATILGKGAFL